MPAVKAFGLPKYCGDGTHLKLINDQILILLFVVGLFAACGRVPVQLNESTPEGELLAGTAGNNGAAEIKDCTTHTASVETGLSADEIKVGEELTVTIILRNTGCLSLGLPQFTLIIEQDENIIVFENPAPVVHSLGVPPGGQDKAVFLLEARAAGEIQFKPLVSFEVHVDYPGPAYWGAANGPSAPFRVIPP